MIEKVPPRSATPTSAGRSSALSGPPPASPGGGSRSARVRQAWQYLTQSPDGDEDPPADSRVTDLLGAISIYLFFCAAASLVVIWLDDAGAPPVLRWIVSSAVGSAGGATAHARYLRRRRMAGNRHAGTPQRGGDR